jgi:2-(3-amino-3-carboxypropyl)histidine synthase
MDGDDSRRRGCAVRFRTIVPQAKPLSPGEVLGCTSPSGLAKLDFDAVAAESSSRRKRREARARMEEVGRNDGDARSSRVSESHRTETLPLNDLGVIIVASEEGDIRRRERVMIFVADGRFHLEAAMMSNPTLRALRYDPYSKTLTEERYETSKMKGLRRDAVVGARRLLGISSSTHIDDRQYRADLFGGVGGGSALPRCGDDVADRVIQPSSQLSPSPQERRPPPTMGIILGTLGRQGNPAILSRVRSLLRSRGIRTIIVLLSEIFPKKLDAMSSGPDGIRAWVQIACPRLSVDWGHHFSVPVLSPYELFVALGEVDDSSLLRSGEVEQRSEGGRREEEEVGYPMDFYSKSGGPWANYHNDNKDRQVIPY